MMTQYMYCSKIFNTLEEAEAAVTELKGVLDNQPIAYCGIKEVSGSEEEGWTAVTNELLTNEEMLSLDSSKHYNIHSNYLGESHIGLTAEETTAKLIVYRNSYAAMNNANILYVGNPPTNEDMSVYVDSAS